MPLQFSIEDHVDRALQSENPCKYVMDLYEFGMDSYLFEGRRMEITFFCHEVCDRVAAVLQEQIRKSYFPYE